MTKQEQRNVKGIKNLQYGIRNQSDVTLCYPLFLLYKLLNMVRATMCPSSGADDCVVLSTRVGCCAVAAGRLLEPVSR